ncbi:LOW QUALITY PROTEIN: RCC1 domain-containing protein 1 [Ixodes scapularis]|nr:LOW QUALITY PROTEIN: RCC1 domain-containing protein 1 [Ixodes scapularis]
MKIYYYFGFNKFNCFTDRVNQPAKVVPDELSTAKTVYIGWSNAVCVTEDGKPYLTGFLPQRCERKVELLKYSSEDDAVSHAVLGQCMLCVITRSGGAYVWHDLDSQPERIPSAGKVKDVAFGDEEGVVLRPDGSMERLYCSTLTLEPLVLARPSIKSVVCGNAHNLALAENGVVFSWGNSSHGELGHGTLDPESTPRPIEGLEGIVIREVSAGGWHSAAISVTDDLYLWGWNESGQLALPCPDGQPELYREARVVVVRPIPHLVASLTDVLTASCGSRHTAAVAGDGTAWAWGCNAYGQLGLKEDLKSTCLPMKMCLPQNCVASGVSCKFWGTLVTCMVPE